MSSIKVSRSRRSFVQSSAAAISALPALASLPRIARSESLPRIDLDDTADKALQYAHDAGTVDIAVRGGADRNCISCRFYTGGEGADWGPCGLFPGKAVNASGWCAGWVAKS